MSREREMEKKATPEKGAAVCASCGIVLKDPDRAVGGRGICLCCVCYEALLNPYPRCCASGAV
ncbi:MAG: hypothetical protein WHT06_01610 [Desulfobacterales bacterium]